MVVIVGAVFLGYSMSGNQRFGGTSNLDTLALSSDLYATGSVNASSTSYFGANVKTGGISTVATTSNAYTLAASNINGISLLSFVGSSTAATTVTIPGTTTLSSFIPLSGDTYSMIIVNATTTGSKLTLAGSPASAVELYSASSTKDVQIGKTAALYFTRMASGTIQAIIVPTS